MLWMPIGGTIHCLFQVRLLVLEGHSTWFWHLLISGSSVVYRRCKELLLAHKSFVIERQGLLSLRSNLSCSGIIFVGRNRYVCTIECSLFNFFDVTIRADISASNVISILNDVEICWSSDWLCRRALVCLSWSHDSQWCGRMGGLIHISISRVLTHWILFAFTVLAPWSVNLKWRVQLICHALLVCVCYVREV